VDTPSATQDFAPSPPPTFPSQGLSTPASPTVAAIPTTLPVVRTNLTATDPASVKLDSGKLQLVEFFAYWCPLCKSMAPVLHLLEDKYSSQVLFSYLDVDNDATRVFKTALGYHFPPQIFLLDGQGKVLQQWSGYVGLDELEKALNDQGVNP
jgi:thiol-disulfide isomerase/thioredoxin